MKDKIMNKKAKLGMSNGHIIDGFVAKEENGFFLVIDDQNAEYWVKFQDVSFVYLYGNTKEQLYEKPEQTYEKANPVHNNPNDFSMSLNTDTKEGSYQSQFDLIKSMK